MIAQSLQYAGTQDVASLLDKAGELGRILNGLIASIKSAA
jgi:hypothetical protein